MGFNSGISSAHGGGGGGGGGGVTAPSLEFGSLLESSETALVFEIVNLDALNPAVVELAFTLSALEAASWDDGTADSPSFGLDPASTREILFVRGSGAPEPGEDAVEETITATLADGSTVTALVDVEAAAGVFKGIMADLGDGPTLEFLFNEVRSGSPAHWPMNKGSLTGGGPTYFWDAQLNGGAAMTTESLDDFDGYAQMGDYNSRMQHLNALPRDSILRTEARSWVYVWDALDDDGVATALQSPDYAIANQNATYHGPGHILTSDLSSPEVIKIEDNGDDIELNATNGTHSGGGSPVGCTLAAGIRTVLVVTYDGGTSTTFRWKQTDDPSGHTYITQDTTAESATGTTGWYWLGAASGPESAINARYRYVGVLDHEITAGEFDNLATAARL